MLWDNFLYMALAVAALWLLGLLTTVCRRPRSGDALFLGGVMVLAIFCLLYWLEVQRPPFRSMGETRLWYAFFAALVGWILYKASRQYLVWLLTALMAIGFLSVNVLHPEIQQQSLMPALQSPWFIPHVMVYMLAYALLACALLLSLVAHRQRGTRLRSLYAHADQLLQLGLALLLSGLLMGALWAKAVWGDFWTWDPKEIWAAMAILAYALVVHHRHYYPKSPRWSTFWQFIAFLLLQMCWYGINYLPAASESLHRY